MNANDTLTQIARIVSETFEPALLPITEGDDAVLALLDQLGYELEAPPAVVADLAQPSTELLGALDQLLTAVFDDTATEAARNQALESAASSLTFALAELIAGIADITSSPSGALPTGVEPDELVRRLLDMLVIRELDRRGQKAAAILRLIGVIDEELVDPVPAGPDKLAVARLEPDRIVKALTDPSGLAHDLYGWGTPQLETDVAFERIAQVGMAFGRQFYFEGMDGSIATLVGYPADDAPSVLRIPIFTDPIELDAVLTPAQGTGAQVPGIGLTFALAGAGETSIPLTERLSLVLDGAGDLSGGLLIVALPGAGIQTHFDLASLLGSASASGEVSLVAAPPPGATRVQLLNVAGAVTLDAAQARIGFGASFAAGVPDVMAELGLTDGMLAIGTGKADGFLAKMLPDGGFKLPLELHLVWSKSKGLQFEGGAGLAIRSAQERTIGPVAITLIEARVDLGTDGLKTRGDVDVRIKLGPFTGAVQGIGARANIAFHAGSVGPVDLVVGFKPPDGAGFSISAGPVTGGGFIYFNPDDEQYAGVLQLSFKAIGITVIGLLTTRLPDASGAPGAHHEGFSLLLIVAVDLPPIQLGYGFTLNGVGGLLGVNRTMVVDALRNGVRDGSVNAILFPQDVVARAPQIISQLQTIFPPVEGRFIFGPMVKIGWGPNAIIEVSVALVLELPSPLRLVILGRIQAALPDKKSTVLNLRLDVVGVLDFDKGEISVDASLVDSRLVVFSLTGDMALRVSWGASKVFAMSAGGFHPKFQPPPNFPQLRRLAIALADSDNPRLRLEAYMALTANTIQFGAALDAYVKVDTFVGTFSVSAKMNFDALIQFSPFELQADLSAGVDIARDGVPFLHAALQASLTGATPWHAVGYAEFDCLGKRRIDFEAKAGPDAPPAITTLRPDEVLATVASAFTQPDAWVGLPPAGGERVASLTDAAGSGADVVVHPLGALAARQRVLPLETTVDRFGAAQVPATKFALESFTIGSGAATPPGSHLEDNFAPGQFRALPDDQALARPAFESQRSGGTVAVGGFAVPSDQPNGVPSDGGYQESIVDTDPSGERSATLLAGTAATIPDHMLAGLASAGAAAGARTRSDGSAAFNGPSLAVAVKPERYVVAEADSLAKVAGAAPESAAQAHDRMDARTGAGAEQVVPEREAA